MGRLRYLSRTTGLKKPGVYGGDRKGYDVHMHPMEAYTNLYEATGDHKHREETQRIINLLSLKASSIRIWHGRGAVRL